MSSGTFPDTTGPDFRIEGIMGGKRPDQHNIDYRDSGTTDNKFLDDDEKTHVEDKQKLQSNPKDQPMIPETGVNPALRELRERQQEKIQPDEENVDRPEDTP